MSGVLNHNWQMICNVLIVYLVQTDSSHLQGKLRRLFDCPFPFPLLDQYLSEHLISPNCFKMVVVPSVEMRNTFPSQLCRRAFRKTSFRGPRKVSWFRNQYIRSFWVLDLQARTIWLLTTQSMGRSTPHSILRFFSIRARYHEIVIYHEKDQIPRWQLL